MTLTSAQFTDEQQCAVAFDVIMAELSTLFTVYSEVPGTLVQPRPGQQVKSMRIDRILVPKSQLIQAGWRHGIVGVELKRSNVKVGPAIAQAIDYSRSVFTIPGGGDFEIWLSYVFIYPFEKEHGDLASILAQNRIGTATSNAWTLLHLASGEQNLLRIDTKKRLTVGTGAPAGRRAGSR